MFTDAFTEPIIMIFKEEIDERERDYKKVHAVISSIKHYGQTDTAYRLIEQFKAKYSLSHLNDHVIALEALYYSVVENLIIT